MDVSSFDIKISQPSAGHERGRIFVKFFCNSITLRGIFYGIISSMLGFVNLKARLGGLTLSVPGGYMIISPPQKLGFSNPDFSTLSKSCSNTNPPWMLTRSISFIFHAECDVYSYIGWTYRR